MHIEQDRLHKGLDAVMEGSPYRSIHRGLSGPRINRFAELMKNGQWEWERMEDPIQIDPHGIIKEGHHRIVAARLAGVEIPEGVIREGREHREESFEWKAVWSLPVDPDRR